MPGHRRRRRDAGGPQTLHGTSTQPSKSRYCHSSTQSGPRRIMMPGPGRTVTGRTMARVVQKFTPNLYQAASEPDTETVTRLESVPGRLDRPGPGHLRCQPE